jgi:quinohemoprotein ethanol dehydrogenase
MMTKTRTILSLSLAALCTAAAAAPKAPADCGRPGARQLDEPRPHLRRAAHSPLARIDAGNVDRLGMAWTVKLDVDRGVEATPIVVDGVMYTTGAWSIVYALDARTGKRCGPSTPRFPARTSVRAAATWSTAASRCGRARSTSAASMAD